MTIQSCIINSIQNAFYKPITKVSQALCLTIHTLLSQFNCFIGVYGGYQSWAKRAGRFRSLGDGQVDFTRVFTLLSEAGYGGWAVLEWECCLKSPEQGAKEGAPFIADHIIETTEVAFDDFAVGQPDREKNRAMLGL